MHKAAEKHTQKKTTHTREAAMIEFCSKVETTELSCLTFAFPTRWYLVIVRCPCFTGPVAVKANEQANKNGVSNVRTCGSFCLKSTNL